jgi:hypothetical protein
MIIYTLFGKLKYKSESEFMVLNVVKLETGKDVCCFDSNNII